MANATATNAAKAMAPASIKPKAQASALHNKGPRPGSGAIDLDFGGVLAMGGTGNVLGRWCWVCQVKTNTQGLFGAAAACSNAILTFIAHAHDF